MMLNFLFGSARRKGANDMLQDAKFHHIGYAVSNIAETAFFYTSGGWSVSKTIIDKVQNSEIAFLSKSYQPLIELVSPIDESSPTSEILNKNGVTLYHICYEVDDIYEAIGIMRKKRFIPLFNPVKAIAFEDRLICYMYNKHVGLIELLSKK